MIRVTELTKDYGSRRAINNLTFHAEKGEILGFLGPNGAGKTTTMRILTGYMPPSSGKVEIGGYDVIDQSIEVRRIVGYLPETVPLYPDMTIFEYLQYMADLRHLKNSEDRVDEVLELVDLIDRSNSFIGSLSKGMRQRVGLAQALLHRPKVLILDEPTIGLDPAQVVTLRKLIMDLGKDRTVLLSTHILPEAQQICNRVLIINKGNIVAEDSPERLQARLTGSQRIAIRVAAGEVNEIIASLTAIPGILGVTPKDDELIEIDSAPGQDHRAVISRTIIEKGFDLLEMRPISMSLEEIFLQLTQDEVPVSEPVTEPASEETGAEEAEEVE